MKTYHLIMALFVALTFSTIAYGQDKDDAKTLIQQGVALHDAGKYDGAIDKYKAALKLEPNNTSALHEIGFTLFSAGRGNDAIPYLEKLLTLDPNAGGAYDLLGSIYDDDKQPEKAINYYKKGIEVAPNYQRLHFNLAITYLRQDKNTEAEIEAIQAIKLEPKHASSLRAYAMALTYQKKRGCALLAWCSFLMVEPQTQRSISAFKNIEDILHYGIKKTGDKSVTLNISTADMNSSNLILPMAILNATSDKKDLGVTDSLTLQLTQVFKISGAFYGDKPSEFYTHYYADYFKKLAESDNMPAFSRFISVATYREENLKWFKDNDKQLGALDTWVNNNKREF